MKVKLYRYASPQQYKSKNGKESEVEPHETVKAAIEKVRNVRKRYKTKGEWVGWKIFDKHNNLIHKLR
jgi:hypothetical protein